MGNYFKLLSIIFLILIILALGVYYIKRNPPEEKVNISSPSLNQKVQLFEPSEIKKIYPPTPTKPIIIPIAENSTSNTSSITSTTTFETTTSYGTTSESNVITITAKEYEFQPNNIKLKAGEKITLIIKNEGVTPHDLKIENESFSIKTKLIAPGSEEKLEFVLPTKGEYKFYCTLHIDKGMEGKIIAE